MKLHSEVRVVAEIFCGIKDPLKPALLRLKPPDKELRSTVLWLSVLGFDLVLEASWLIKQWCVGSNSWRHIQPDILKRTTKPYQALDSQHCAAHKQLWPAIYFALISRYNMKGFLLSHWIQDSRSSECWQHRPESAWKRRFVRPLSHTRTHSQICTHACT